MRFYFYCCVVCILVLCAVGCGTTLNPLSIFDRDYTRRTDFDKYDSMPVEDLAAYKAEILQLAATAPKDALYSVAFYRVANVQDVRKALAAASPLEHQRLSQEYYHRASPVGLHGSRGSWIESIYATALNAAMSAAVPQEIALLLVQNGQVVEYHHLEAAVNLYSNLDVFKVLLPYVSTEERERLLLHAIGKSSNWAEAVTELARQGVNMQAPSQGGHVPLVLHAQKGNYSAVKILLDNGALVNAMDKYGSTALWKAVEYNYHGEGDKVVLLLLKRGAEPVVSGNGNSLEQNLLKYYLDKHSGYHDYHFITTEHFNSEIFRAMLAAYPKDSLQVREVYEWLQRNGLHESSHGKEIMRYFKR